LTHNRKSKTLLIDAQEDDLESFCIGGYNSGDKIVKYKRAFIFCSIDRIATGLLRRMNELELKIPEDYAVLGFDDDLHSQYMSKSLSSISIPVDELCDKTVLCLKKLLNEEKTFSDIHLLTHFIERETT
jgi:LacI family transcriptional regulator